MSTHNVCQLAVTFTAVEPDVLGTPYERRTLSLRADGEGPVTATLVHRRAENAASAAVLYVHGFVDYFFQTHVADFFAARGIDFFALDLRKHGRSLQPHQTPNFATDLREYYEELDAAVRLIREEHGHTRVALAGHSTGGLLTSLWAHDRRADGLVDALVLNSAFFDVNQPWFMRQVASPLTVRVGRAKPKTKLPFGLNPVYGESVHSSARGEWDFNLDWKPRAGFPIYAGWIAAIRTGQKRVHAGLDIAVPVFSAASTASYKSFKWSEAARSADSILDVDHITRWSAGLGRLVTIARIEGGLHDLTLSARPAREQFFTEVGRWLDVYLPGRG
jgi:alpha-beta hydrolase superfamily lysophospholipase